LTEKERIKKIKAIQKILGVKQDGIIGPITRGAFEALGRAREWHNAKASSFADPEDIRKYRECRAKGYSESYCLKHAGDNGVGRWGDDTTGASPACALNTRHIVDMWGSVTKGKHKPVDVEIDDQVVTCILKDTGAPIDRIDLNPGAVAAFGMEPPILVRAKWKWS
jgi:hypothetical protein